MAGLFAVVAALAVIARGDATGFALAAAALAGASATLGPEALAWLREREASTQARQQQIRALLVRWPLSVQEADERELGVPESKIANQYRREGKRPPYVSRDQDEELRRALATSWFVMLVGPSKAGKSRTAVEALRSKELGLGDRALLVPVRPSDDPHSLRSLAALRPCLALGPDLTVLWLDDVDEYLRAGTVSATLLRRWREDYPRGMILATIREGALADLRGMESERSSSDAPTVGKDIGEVLDQAHQVQLPREPSLVELRRASELYPGQDFSDGIGTSLIDAPRLVDRLRTGPSRCREGVAIVRSAVDWRRAGVTRRATREDLYSLAGVYLEGARSSAVDLDRGLVWALERLESGAALLEAEAAYRQALNSGHNGAAAMAEKYFSRLRDPSSSRRGVGSNHRT
jgi:cellulose synthase operon protein C